MIKRIKIVGILLLNEFRDREAIMFSILLPLAILILIGSTNKSQLTYVYPGIIAIAFGSIALVGFPSQLTTYRKAKILQRVYLTDTSLGSFVNCVYLSQMIFMLVQFSIVTVVMEGIYGTKFKIDHTYLFACGIEIILSMLAFLAIGTTIGAISKNNRIASTIGNTIIVIMIFVGNTLFPSTGWPKLVRETVKYFPMNSLDDAMRRTLMYNTQTWQHFVIQFSSLLICFIIFEIIGKSLLKRSVTQ